MFSLISNWRLIGVGVAVLAILAGVWYVENLRSDVRSLTDANAKLQTQSEQQISYITRYETAKAQDEKLIQELSEAAKEIPVNTACPAPSSFTAVLKRL